MNSLLPANTWKVLGPAIGWLLNQLYRIWLDDSAKLRHQIDRVGSCVIIAADNAGGTAAVTVKLAFSVPSPVREFKILPEDMFSERYDDKRRIRLFTASMNPTETFKIIVDFDECLTAKELKKIVKYLRDNPSFKFTHFKGKSRLVKDLAPSPWLTNPSLSLATAAASLFLILLSATALIDPLMISRVAHDENPTITSLAQGLNRDGIDAAKLALPSASDWYERKSPPTWSGPAAHIHFEQAS